MTKNKNSVQDLIGLERFTRFGVKTDKAEIAFFSVEPTNISVLSAANIDVKIHHLMMLLSTIPDLEILALDSCECFDSNKMYVKKRLQTEQNEAVRKLLQADYDFLDEIQVEMSSARQFIFALRFKREKDEQIFNTINRVDKAIAEHGFSARRMSKSEVKRMIALYFGTSISGDEIPDVEGETEFELEVKTMRNKRQKKKELSDEQLEIVEAKGFFDRTMPGVIRFYTDHYICGNFYKSCWAVTEYPPSTEETAILAHLADRNGVTLRIYNRLVTSMEQRKIVQQAMRKNHMMTTTNDVNESIKAQNNIDDVVELLSEIRRNKEPLLHTAVFLELKASSEDKLKELQADVQMELTRSKISVDRLLLRQKEGFLSVHPAGNNVFARQFERVLPASSVADLYPLNYSGKTDKNGFYIGRDKYGSNVLVDFDRRTEDKTNSNILILGNSGQGKSYLMKLLLCNQREAGKSILCLDPEAEYHDLCSNLGGTYIDMMSGEFMINPLEPKAWGDGDRSESDSPEAFRKVTRLSQHISYLKDFFRAYKDFSDAEVDTIEIMLMKLYARFGIDDFTDFSTLNSEDYPIMSDLYELLEKEFMAFDHDKKHLYTEEMLQNICLGLHSMCKGAESKYFDGHTNIKDGEFICFGVKGLMDTNKRLKDTLLFNILSYMSNQLLGKGNTVAAVDELYLFLTNMTAIEYIRNGMKRVRKKESSFILASQNIEDFLLPEIKEFTKPLFSIPSHHFLFNPGNISPIAFIDTLQLEESEYGLIKYPERGTCLYRCGNERYLLQVIAPAYKAALFGAAGGR